MHPDQALPWVRHCAWCWHSCLRNHAQKLLDGIGAPSSLHTAPDSFLLIIFEAGSYYVV